jgi:hypothetical protein
VLFIDGGHGKVALMGMHTLVRWHSQVCPRSDFVECCATTTDMRNPSTDLEEVKGRFDPSFVPLEDG